eukprot:s436_g30.t1
MRLAMNATLALRLTELMYQHASRLTKILCCWFTKFAHSYSCSQEQSPVHTTANAVKLRPWHAVAAIANPLARLVRASHHIHNAQHLLMLSMMLSAEKKQKVVIVISDTEEIPNAIALD